MSEIELELKRCPNVDRVVFSDDTVEITGRLKQNQQEVGCYACSACGKVAYVSTKIMDDPDFENRANSFNTALKVSGFCEAAILVAPFNEGNVALSANS